MAGTSFKIDWNAHDYEHKERNADWFWAVGIVAVAIAVVAVILGNIIFAILVIISVFALSLFINRHPETITVEVNERGIQRDKIFYPYDTLDSFWIDVEHPHKKIILKSKKLLMPLIIVPLGDKSDPERLRRALTRHLREQYHALPWLENFLEYLGF